MSDIIMPVDNELIPHYNQVARALLRGKVIPFFGAGVNLWGRDPKTVPWERGKHLPNGNELALHLVDNFDYPSAYEKKLDRVSQYISLMEGNGPLYEVLHLLFNAEYPVTDLHRFFASLPQVYHTKHQLIISTNYDDLMEKAFNEVDQPFDLITYDAEGTQRGKFWHTPPGGKPQVIELPNEYTGIQLDEYNDLLRPVVLKIHGAFDRCDAKRDSYVITEDHYIDYLTRTDLSILLPQQIAGMFQRNHFLFLGYSLQDWNLRVILQRLWDNQRMTWKSWAIMLNPSKLDLLFWKKGERDVEIIDRKLEDYVTALKMTLQSLSNGN